MVERSQRAGGSAAPLALRARFRLRPRAGAATAAVVGLLAAGCGSAGAGAGITGGRPPSLWAGATLVQPLPKPGFTLTDTSERPFNLLTDTHNKVTLVYFGYTRCPDVCPLNMFTAARALKLIPAEDRARVAVVFVTTDPARDTPPVLRKWLDGYDPSFIGLTGTLEQVRQAQHDAGVDLATFEPADVSGGYGVDHAGYVLAYTLDNLAHIAYPGGVKIGDEARDLQRLVEHGFTPTGS